jgi:surface carbohydrate biosynthesis protein
MHLLRNEFWALAPDFVLLNFLRANNESLARQLLEAGIGVGVLDTEGGVLEDFNDYAQFLAPDPAVRRGIACYFSWGTRLAEHAQRVGWYGEGQVAVTGTPRYDFYALPWRLAALRSSPYADAFGRPMVLITGNFALSNPRFQPPEAEARSMVEQFGCDRDAVLAWQATQRQTMLGMARLANSLAARFPQVTFVYRPHPFEKLESYHDLLEPRPNLHLVKQGTVDGWVLRACAVIQRNSSTAVEAGFAGVPALLPTWLPTILQAPAAAEVSVPCETEGELARHLEAIVAGRFQPLADVQRRLEGVIGDWFCRIDGCAHERVADRLLQSVPSGGRAARLRHCQATAYGRSGRSSLRQRARAALVGAFGLSVHWSFRKWANVTQGPTLWPRPEKYFNAQHVAALMSAIQGCARNGSDQAGREVGVQAAQERGDYLFGYLRGQSVAVFPN